jgi:signal transduction histidine kinase
LAAAACLVWAGYRWRLRRTTRRVDSQYQERLAERTRIAQDLHDTLLQGCISASMQLSFANRQLPSDSPAKSLVNDVLELMNHVVDEGRNAVRGMRLSSGESDDLDVRRRNNGLHSAESLIRVHRQEADRQKLLVKKSQLTEHRLLFIVSALRNPFRDENFTTLLRAEGLESLPAYLAERIQITEKA